MSTAFHFGLLSDPAMMGIVNITPNSFSDTGAHFDARAAVDHAQSLANQGAQILDLGAEASSFFRPGVEPVPAEEQLRRLKPVMAAIRDLPHTFISIDTRSAEVARETISRGAHIINDISAGTFDAAMLETVAGSKAAIILMHVGKTFPDDPPADDPDILNTVRDYLAERVAAASKAGIPRDRMAIDPGLGFGKTPLDNWILALRTQGLQSLNVPIVLGASRKRFLESTPPSELAPHWQELVHTFNAGALTHPRDPATAAITRLAVMSGIAIHRVHNVALAAEAATR